MSSDQVHLGHRARKRFGQNFLNDPYIIDGIVSAINPRPGQNLVEIGPGLVQSPNRWAKWSTSSRLSSLTVT